MEYFNQDTLRFLQELPKNNNKEWFDQNKIRYKKEVQIPFKNFISDLILELHPCFPNLNIESKDCIFRIYRDVRFSKDKTPYKNHISAMITPGGRKDKTTPGLYIEFSKNDFRFYSGCFELTSNQTKKIRTHILDNLDEFESLISDSDFRSTFGEIKGDKYKRMPIKYQDYTKHHPLLLNKSFYYFKKYDPDFSLKSNLLKTIIVDFQKCFKLNDFFSKALNQ